VERLNGYLAALLARASGAQDEEGQTLIEYGLIVALVSIVAILALTAVGTNVSAVFTSIAGKLHS
jgi:pilus assembly protein Flp/PilA